MSAVLLVVTPFNSQKTRRFGGAHHLHIKGTKRNLSTCSGFLVDLLFVSEDIGDMFLGNVGISPNYKPEEIFFILTPMGTSNITECCFVKSVNNYQIPRRQFSDDTNFQEHNVF